MADLHPDPNQQTTQTLATLACIVAHLSKLAGDREDRAIELQIQVDELTRERSALLSELKQLKTPPRQPIKVTQTEGGVVYTQITVACVINNFKAGMSLARIADVYAVPIGHAEAVIRRHLNQPKTRNRRRR